MIKETVDAVRLAELEGDKVISTAKVNGQDMKNQVKIQGAEYRTERLRKPRKKQKRKWQRQLQNAKSTMRSNRKRLT